MVSGDFDVLWPVRRHSLERTLDSNKAFETRNILEILNFRNQFFALFFVQVTGCKLPFCRDVQPFRTSTEKRLVFEFDAFNSKENHVVFHFSDQLTARFFLAGEARRSMEFECAEWRKMFTRSQCKLVLVCSTTLRHTIDRPHYHRAPVRRIIFLFVAFHFSYSQKLQTSKSRDTTASCCLGYWQALNGEALEKPHRNRARRARKRELVDALTFIRFSGLRKTWSWNALFYSADSLFLWLGHRLTGDWPSKLAKLAAIWFRDMSHVVFCLLFRRLNLDWIQWISGLGSSKLELQKTFPDKNFGL